MKLLTLTVACLMLAGCSLNPFRGPVADHANNWTIHRATPCSEPEVLSGPRAGWVRRDFCTDEATIRVYFPVGISGISRQILSDLAVAATEGRRYFIDGRHLDIAGHLAHVADDFSQEGK